MHLTPVVKSFNELSPAELYAILQLRNEVFVVEQNCPYQDADGKDLKAHHLCLYTEDGLLAAYARLLPAGVSYQEMSIGRVVSSPQARGTGAGRQLMIQAIEHVQRLFGPGNIRIGAQVYIKAFYASLGFVEQGEEYDEDGIPHVEMVLVAAAPK